MLSMVRTSAKQRCPQRPEFADTTVWGVASFVSRLSIGCAKVAATSLRRCTRGGVIVINSPLNLNSVLVCLAHLQPCGETLSDQAPTTDLGALLRSTVVSLRQLQDGAVQVSALHNLIQSHFGILGPEDASVLLRALLHALPSHLG